MIEWLILYMMNTYIAVQAIVGDPKPCGSDVLCEGKDPKRNPEYFKPLMNNLRRCYCDEGCVEVGDCCLDRAPFPYTPSENITWSCVAKSYNETIYAVSNCDVNEFWRGLCRKEVYVPKKEYLTDLPVFSNYTGLYYANMFCAFCDSRLWLKYGSQLPHYFAKPKTLTQCTPGINLKMLKAEGQYLHGRLIWKVRDGYCILFQQDIVERGRACLPSVSGCPAGTDSLLSSKCAAYSQLLSKNDTVYKNPYCAICNGEDKSDSFCEYKKHTFELPELTDLIDLNWNLEDCEENMRVSDNLHQGCQAINCNLNSGKCQINECDSPCHSKGNLIMPSGYINYPCLSASIVCLLIHIYKSIFITPPKNLPSRILNSLAWAMVSAQTLFLTSTYSIANIPHYKNLCYIVSVTTFYFFLASFFWMSVISFDIWFTFANTFKLFKTSYKKYALCAWGGSGIIILISVIFDQADCIPPRFRPKFGPTHNACWLGTYNGMAFFLATPIGLVLLVNTIFFAMTIRLLRKQRNSVYAISGIKEYSLLLIYIKISTVIGMTWVAIFLITAFKLNPEIHFALSVINSLQGVFIFIMFHIKTDFIFTYIKHLLLKIFGNK